MLATVSLASKPSRLDTDAPARLLPMVALVRDGLTPIRNGDGREDLYDMADPDEARDLAASPGRAADLARLRGQLSGLVAPGVRAGRR